jgi:hypothetical protein
VRDNVKYSSCYEEYPFWVVLPSNLVSLAIYAIGAFIIYKIHWVWLILYILFILWLEIQLLRKSCVNCYYYGKTCAFGRGKLACLFFKKGDSLKFSQRQATWKDILPDILVSVIPIIAGVVLLIIDFSWVLLVMVLLLLLLTSIGNGIVRGSLACKYCKQREIGCPAEQLFKRNKSRQSTP